MNTTIGHTIGAADREGSQKLDAPIAWRIGTPKGWRIEFRDERSARIYAERIEGATVTPVYDAPHLAAAPPSAGSHIPNAVAVDASAPDEVGRFTYLLNAMEHAAQQDKPAAHEYGAKRKAVFAFVGNLAALLLRERENVAELHRQQAVGIEALNAASQRAEQAEARAAAPR